MALQQIGLKAVLDLSSFNRAYNDYLSKLNHMNTQTGGAASRLNQHFLGLGTGILKVAGYLSGALVTAAGLAAVAIGKVVQDGIKDAMDLEQSIADIAAVLNITTDEAGFLKDTIIELGIDPTLRVSTEEAGQALYVLAQAGIFTGMTMAEMETAAYDAGKAVVMLANATGANFDQSAAIATDAMTLFNINASDMVAVVSDITSVVTTSKFTIDDYELALRNGGAAAAQMGVSLNDFNAVVAASAEELGSGRRAGTGMLNFINRLTPNTQKATDVMADLGFIVNGNNQFFDEATGELKSMEEIAVMLNDRLYDSVAVVTEVGGRTAEQNAILAQMVDEYKDAEQTVFDYTKGASSLLATEEEKNDALDEAFGIMEKLGPSINELNGITGEYSISLEKMRMEQRWVALETLFGNDGMKTAIALANEGAEANLTVADTMEIFGVNMQEANAMMAEGITNWDVLNANMGKTDAIQNAITRTDTLKAKWENIKDAWTAAKIQALDPLIQALEKIVDERIIPFIQNSDGLIERAKDIGQAFADLVTAVVDSGTFYEPFLMFLVKIGEDDVADKIEQMRNAIIEFVTPIKEFVEKHKDGFIGALNAIKTLAVASVIYAIAAAVISLMTGIGGLIAIVGLLGYAWGENWGNIQGIVETAATAISNALDSIGITDFMDELKAGFEDGGFSGLVDAVPEAFSNLGATIIGLIQNIDWLSVATSIREGLVGAMSNLGTMAGEAINWFVEMFGNIDWATVGQTIVDGIIGFVALHLVVDAVILEAIFNFFKSLFETVDWGAAADTIGQGLLDLLTGAFARLTELNATYTIPFLENLWATFVSWGSGQVEIAKQWAIDTIILPIITGLLSFSERVGETLQGWWTAINTWFTQNITWESLGYHVTTALLNVFVGFPMQLGQTLQTWWTAFYTWVTTTDWKTIGETVKTRIKESLELFVKVVAIILNGWWNSISTWFTAQKWETLGDEVTEDIDTSLKLFWTNTKSSFDEWWNSVKLWFDTTTWDALGQAVIAGVKKGLTDMAQDLYDAVTGIAAGAKAAWDAYWDTHSPSRVMVSSGLDIMQGIIIGLESGSDGVTSVFMDIFGNLWSFIGESWMVIGNITEQGATDTVDRLRTIFSGLEDIFEFGSGLSGIAGGFASRFKEMIVDPAREAKDLLISELTTGQDSALAGLLESTGLTELTGDQIKDIAMGGVFLDSQGFQVDPTETMIKQAQELLALQRQLTQEKNKTLVEEQQLAALQEQQANFAYLQQQMDLLKFIEDNELNATDILGGLELGLNADISGLLQAMTDAMAAVVQVAEEELGIASPSKVFAAIGQNITDTLASNLDFASIFTRVQTGMGSFVGDVNSLIPNVRMGSGGDAQQGGNVQNYNVQNNFTGSPQITDSNALRRVLAG